MNEVPPVHRETLANVLSLFAELPGDRVRLELVSQRPAWIKLVATPSNGAAATVEVWFYGEDNPRDIGPVAGVEAGLNLATDLFGEAEGNWRQFLEGLLRGIIEGTLVEKLEYRGDRLVKVTFAVRVGQETFTFTRSSFPNWLRGLFSKRTEKTVSYGPYASG